MPFRHIAAGRGAEHLAEHRDEAGHALIAEVGGRLLDRRTGREPLHREHDAELLAPATEAHAGFPADQPLQRPLAEPGPLRPQVECPAIRRGIDHRIDDPAQTAIGRHRQVEVLDPGLGVRIYERAGLLKPALKLIERAIERHDVLLNRLTWMQLLIRLGHEDRMQAWMAGVPEFIDGLPHELMGLAQLIGRYSGKSELALALGYRALRAGYNQPKMHLAYALGLIVGGRASDVTMAGATVIEAGLGVVLINDATNEELHRVIETGPSPVIERDELAPDDPLAKKLIGLQVGSTLEFVKMGIGPQTYRVAEIQTRFLFAFRRTMREFSTLFPDNPSLGSFTIDEAKGDNRFDDMLALARDRADQGQQLETTYRDNVIPIAMFARFSGTNIFDLWDTFSQKPDLGLKVALGSEGEFEAGQKAAAYGISVVEPLSIYAWTRMGLVSSILKLSHRLAVVQSSIDALRHLLDERTTQRGQKMGTFGYDGGQYYLVELSEEAIDAQVANAKAALDLAEALSLVPAETDKVLPDGIIDLLDGLHPAYQDSLIAALQPNRALLTDDLAFRVIAQQAGARVAWTQSLAQSAQTSGQLSHFEYRQVVGGLQDANYNFVQFGALEILGELQGAWKATDRLRAYARLLTSDSLNRTTVAVLIARLLLESRKLTENASEFVVFPALYLEISRERGRESQAIADFKEARKIAEVFHAHAVNRIVLPAKLLCTTYITPVADLAQASSESAARTVGRLWADLRKAGLEL
jgi:cellulose synthase operon protein C